MASLSAHVNELKDRKLLLVGNVDSSALFSVNIGFSLEFNVLFDFHVAESFFQAVPR
jgi:hypothetical protein